MMRMKLQIILPFRSQQLHNDETLSVKVQEVVQELQNTKYLKLKFPNLVDS
jgi:hypothetical protein